MAEIKSTMDMVMERAARMAAGPEDDNYLAEEQVKEGMRLGAAYMRGEGVGLGERLAALPPAEKGPVRKGAVQSLLRNIFLVREVEKQEVADKAMHGLVEIGQGDGELLKILAELKKILDGYRQHGLQLREQLEAQFSQQLAMMEQNLAKQTGRAMKLQPSQHPKFQEEWARIQDQLNEQYGKALQQLKDLVEQHLVMEVAP
ncbi:DUF6657 family protein [Thiovibrio frasassiensis]|uniref:Uncharacterized protein n=1 Tax=Thiovibrio frasassiensis TaxID=2984131 RepID=A0A9X4RL64_9BACT|nr:DUF6657 family protein [Thiovibrio frasassiensis]MDG4475344.1 hypothetical protein [Thiovibrio frasassiensis]